MEFQHIELEHRGPVGWLRFARAPVNAFHWPMLREVVPALDALRNSDDIRVVVLASAVERYFSSGADLATFKDMDAQGMDAWVTATHGVVRALRAGPKPVLAAVNGVAVGGGFEMALHADLRFAAADARIGQPEINIAFIPPVGATQALVRLVGRPRAFRILYEGDLMDAETAREMGLIDFVVEAGRLESDVQAYAERLATRPANTLAAIRRCLIDGGSVDFEAGLAIEHAQAVDLAGHTNFAEGVAAFLEKRKPQWR